MERTPLGGEMDKKLLDFLSMVTLTHNYTREKVCIMFRMQSFVGIIQSRSSIGLPNFHLTSFLYILLGYFEGIRKNLELMPIYYPGWVMRLYHDLDPTDFIAKVY